MEKLTKERLTIYIDPSLHKWLWRQRAETGKSVSEIAEDLMVRRIGRDAHDREQAVKAKAVTVAG
jgi:hypothetical protein